jgi:trehalose synthase-fused probable maltokinase
MVTKKKTAGASTSRRRALPPEELIARAAQALPALLPGQRWFAGKARGIARVSLADSARLPETSGVLALFDVTLTDGTGERYLIPLAPPPVKSAVPFHDAMLEGPFCIALVEQIRQGAALPGTRGTFRCAPTPAFTSILPEPPRQAAPIGAEQSNSSVVFDKQAILKLFRRVAPGLNPEFEVTEFLTRATNFSGAARLLGAVQYETRSGETSTLAVLQQFVPQGRDAWAVTLSRLAEYYRSALEDLEQSGPGAQAFARTLAEADAQEARDLGSLTGRLHMALASGTEPAFAPERIAAADLNAWQTEMRAGLERTMDLLGGALPTLPEAAQPLADEVLRRAPDLAGALLALQALEEAQVMKIRVHGDYHLGQILNAGDDFVILDFEGEPDRPIAYRRAKHCALKDVAGMLRSFAYAAHAGLLAAVAPGDARLLARLAPWAERWQTLVQEAFLQGYVGETWEREAGFLPRRREALEAVLRVFELDKLLYELAYELNHRPEWVRIPLDGLRQLLLQEPKAQPTGLRTGQDAFSFVACLELREFLGVRAENERQLADLIEEVSADSIYYHTHGFFLRHKFVAGAYPNDFATWAASQVRDRVLGERLAMVDPGEFATLQDLREELVAVIDDHLRDLQIVPSSLFGEPFEFIQSRLVEIPTGVQVRTLQELRDALLEIDVSAIYYHLVEARIRLGRGQNDFAAWLTQGLGLSPLAEKVRSLDPYAGSLEQIRSRLIQLCDEALAEGLGR